MKDICINHFKALCPTCGKVLADRTCIDQKGPTYFLRTIFECEGDNWALMTCLDEYNTLGLVDEINIKKVMRTPLAQVKLDLTLAVIANFIRDGVRNDPLSTVEKFVKNNDTWYEKRMTGNAAAFLHIFYQDLAARYSEQGDKEKQGLALEYAVAYLMRMEGDELANARDNKSDCDDALQIFAALSGFFDKNGKTARADGLKLEAQVWLQKENGC
jgi:hypothetical protein